VIGAESARACPLCGSSEAAAVLDASVDAARFGSLSFASRKPPELMHWRLVTCAVCDLLYASPAPDADALLHAYRGAGFDARSESSHAARTYADIVARLLPRLPGRSGALDVGAGDGAFVARLLELGFSDVAGLEPSGAARELASPAVRELIRDEPFRPRAFAAGRFALVTCLQTIEHLPEPLAVAREARRLLRGGGAFLVVCHDRGAWQSRLLGRRSPIYDVEHLQLFDGRTIRLLLERAGFERVEVHGLVNRYPLAYWLRLARAPQRLVRALGRVGSLPVSLPVGNVWAVGYRDAGSV
jgi:SAM-dependent methyltransferase